MISGWRLPGVVGGVVVAGAGLAALVASIGGGPLPVAWGGAALAALAGAVALSLGAGGPQPCEAWYAGVAGRLARPGRPAWAIRLAVVAAAPVAGLGVAAYACAALVTTLTAPPLAGPQTDAFRATATGFLGLAFVLAAGAAGLTVGDAGILWASLLIGAGLPLFWGAAGPRRGPDGRRAGEDAGVRTALGLVLAAGGAGWVLSRTGLFRAAEGTIAGTAIAVGVLALVVGPRWLRTSRMLAVERGVRARAQERAEMADHLHDSVLQTLVLIQRRAGDEAEVSGLARRQERELREWLFVRPPDGGVQTLGGALRAVAAEIEDTFGIEVSVVTAGDGAVDAPARALLAAAREALTNAALHADGAAVSVFGRVDPEGVHVFVHDRGPGFDLDAIPVARRGVRESIVGRLERCGGRAEIRTAPGEGCEVALHLERS